MEAINKVKGILVEILDIEPAEIDPETYIIRDLGAESIDLLELAVELNAGFNKAIKDDDIFLRRLRDYLIEAKESGQDPSSYLAQKFAFLSEARIGEILSDLADGPVLKVKDLISYVSA